MSESIPQEKMAKAYTILSKGDRPSQIDDETFTVPSQTGAWFYDVKKNNDDWSCTCPSHSKLIEAQINPAHCKHIYTVQFWLNLKDELREEVKDSKPLSFHACDKCGSHEIVKNGSRKTKQGKKTRLLCKSCNHTFVLEDEGFNDMKFDSEIVTEALNLYFSGMSLRKVSHHIEQFRGVNIDHTTVFKWIKKYGQIIASYVDTLEPQLGEMWGVDEMAVRVKQEGIKRQKGADSKWVWLWNMMDTETRYLISNIVTKKRGVKEAQKIFQDVKDKAGKPKYVVSDGMHSYKKAFNKVFYDHHQSCKHISEVGIKDRVNNNLLERCQGSIRDRNRVMRGLGNPESSEKILDAHRVYYNHIRPHMALDGKTPAEVAGLDLNLGHNKWKGLIEKAIENKTLEKIEAKKEIESKTRLDYWV